MVTFTNLLIGFIINLIERINFLRDTAEIKIYYDDPTRSGRAFAWLGTEMEEWASTGD